MPDSRSFLLSSFIVLAPINVCTASYYAGHTNCNPNNNEMQLPVQRAGGEKECGKTSAMRQWVIRERLPLQHHIASNVMGGGVGTLR